MELSKYFYIIDGETEAQGREAIFPRPHSKEDTKLKLKVRHFLRAQGYPSKVRAKKIRSELVHCKQKSSLHI